MEKPEKKNKLLLVGLLVLNLLFVTIFFASYMFYRLKNRTGKPLRRVEMNFMNNKTKTDKPGEEMKNEKRYKIKNNRKDNERIASKEAVGFYNDDDFAVNEIKTEIIDGLPVNSYTAFKIFDKNILN